MWPLHSGYGGGSLRFAVRGYVSECLVLPCDWACGWDVYEIDTHRRCAFWKSRTAVAFWNRWWKGKGSLASRVAFCRYYLMVSIRGV